jgi:cell division protein FtsW
LKNIRNLSQYLKGDIVIWSIALLLGLISILAVYSATSSLAYRQMHGNTEYYLVKHTFLVLCSFVAMWVVHNIDYRYFSGLAKIGLWISVPILIITWRYGVKLNDASRWISLPLVGKSFQPSDMAQIALITYVSVFIARKQTKIQDYRKSLLPILQWCILICGLIALANVSAAIILFAICIALLYIGRIPIKHLFLVTIIVMILGAGIVSLGQRKYTVLSRIESFMSGKAAFQTEQSYIAIATGGIYGKGPGNSTQRNILPHPYSDFIYAILVEEYGLIGAIFILLLYLSLLYRGIHIVTYTDNVYRSLISIGLSLSITFQAFVNIGVSLGLGPVTGVTLPFISMGGTSLLFTGIAFGMIISATRGEIDESIKKNNLNNNIKSSESAITNIYS